MSGVKTISLVAGGAPALGTAAAVAGGVILATGAVVVAGAAVAAVTVNAAQAYQERARRERERAIQREQDVQRRIAEIRAQVDRNSGRKKKEPMKVSSVASTSVNRSIVSPSPAKNTASAVTPVSSNTSSKPELDQVSSQKSIDPDTQRKVQDLKSRLPRISSEYQSLVAQQLLDPITTEQALEKVQQALNKGDLPGAEAFLKALDDARKQVLNDLKASWQAGGQYVQERLDGLRDRLPQAVERQLQAEIDQVLRNGPPPDDPDLLALHQRISDYEAQVEHVAETASHLLNSWSEVGYAAHLSGIDDGDLLLTVETHEGENTEMRVQFEGQQLVLNGPSEETGSCAARTRDMLQLFQQQGYYLEWDSLDGVPVPEEWRTYYSAEVGDDSVELPEEEPVIADQALPETEGIGYYAAPEEQRRSESQGY